MNSKISSAATGWNHFGGHPELALVKVQLFFLHSLTRLKKSIRPWRSYPRGKNADQTE
jgi:hypothetical protein